MHNNENDDSLMKEPESSADDAEPPGPFIQPYSQDPFQFVSEPPAAAQLRARRHGPVISESARSFRRRFFPGVSKTEWLDWRWQIRNSITTPAELQRCLDLSKNETLACLQEAGSLPLRITPYYASLIDPQDQEQPLRKCVVPRQEEMVRQPGEEEDPLHEDDHCPTRGLIHRYPDRVLFLVSGFCATYCRYCTRSRLIDNREKTNITPKDWERGLTYIALNPAIRDVLISGGDPLTLSDQQLDYLLTRLQQISHLEFLRIGTKVPVVLPQRITPRLLSILKKFKPLWLSIHFSHPAELTPECCEALDKLADAGLPLGSQTVLLKGVNDDIKTMTALMHGLLRNRVRPYYLYQCDPVSGSAHFRTPVARGLEIIRGLRGYTSGYAVPQFVVDAPGGGGKIPLLPEYNLGHVDSNLILQNYQGRLFHYPDTALA